MLTITSLQNPRIRQLLALHEGRERRRLGLYLIEGEREIERFALSRGNACSHAHPDGLLELYIATSAFERPAVQALLDSSLPIESLFEVPDGLFEKISLRQSPDGLLALAAQRELSLDDIDWSGPTRLVVAQSIEKPGNLGALLRLCDGVGAKALILCERQIEIWNPNVIRASMGSFFHVPTIEMSSANFFEFAHKQGFQIVAASPHAKRLYTEVAYSPRVALVLGAEDRGLSEEWTHANLQQIRLPMLGMADSLNVSTAAAICLYEILRQHQLPSSSAGLCGDQR